MNVVLLWVPAGFTDEGQPVKNVIVMIADGCGSEHYTLARWYKGAPLALDDILCGGIKTFISDSVIADSAPAATAFATGFRSSDNFIGVGPKSGTLRPDLEPSEDLRYRPLGTVLEGARLLGKATGLVATSRLSHATPAGYSTHVVARSLEEDIMEQMVYQNVDVLLGGGIDYLLPKGSQGKRTDGEDLWSELRARGYVTVENRQQLESASGAKVYGAFAMGHMAPEVDRTTVRPDEPTLAEMTRHALRLLSADPDGFFVMIEGSQIDWANHANDPAHLLGDMLAYDDAVQVALEFAKQRGDTLVLSMSDHNTGGMSIGNRGTNTTYSQTSLAEVLDPLRKMRASAPEMWRQLCVRTGASDTKPKDVDPQHVQEVVAECWGVTLTINEARHLLELAGENADNPQNAFGALICPKWTALGYTTHGHTGGDVPLFAYGPGRPIGLLDAPEIAQVTARALGVNLEQVTNRLHVDLQQALPGAKVTVDSSKSGAVVRVEWDGKTAELPVNKSVLLRDGQTTQLEGLVVYMADIKKVFVPLQAVQLLTGKQDPLPSVAQVSR
jgi:alkaline phosphatase